MPPAGLLHHSDKGSQYCSHEYTADARRPGNERLHERNRKLLRQRSHGELLGNAEETELIFHRHFASQQQAIREITEYIEVFYNRQRLQRQLGLSFTGSV